MIISKYASEKYKCCWGASFHTGEHGNRWSKLFAVFQNDFFLLQCQRCGPPGVAKSSISILVKRRWTCSKCFNFSLAPSETRCISLFSEVRILFCWTSSSIPFPYSISPSGPRKKRNRFWNRERVSYYGQLHYPYKSIDAPSKWPDFWP